MSFLKDYEPVEDRLARFWVDHPNGRILTERQAAPDGEYVFSAEAYRDAADDGAAATGWAHEAVALLPAGMKASALEVCETSAIGRCLANLGYAARGKRPSREEMESKNVRVGGTLAQGTTSRPASGSDRTSAPSGPREKTVAGTDEGGPSKTSSGSANVGEAAAGPLDTSEDFVALLKLAVDHFGGSVNPVVRRVREFDSTVRSEADLRPEHVIRLMEKEGVL